MLTVKTPGEVLELVQQLPLQKTNVEQVPLCSALGRVLGETIHASEYVPNFNRSTVDGYAVRGSDTFGCSDSIPAVLSLTGAVKMGRETGLTVQTGTCVAVPTGGEIPDGADAVVMEEYTEDYGDGTIGILKSASPGANVVYRGDDVFPGKTILQAGRRITAPDIGALAAIGMEEVPVAIQPRVGIISTGDELVEVGQNPGPGQVRDVNSSLMAAAVESFGGQAVHYGILKDEEALLRETVALAAEECDCVLISGGSSVGKKDVTCQILNNLGTLLFHGIAMKPGKPTIMAMIGDKPVIGLPGHPCAAFFVAHLFVRPMLWKMMGQPFAVRCVEAVLTETVSANHGRAQYTGVHLIPGERGLNAVPIHSKSGLISSLAGSDGYFEIPRNCEGLAAGSRIAVTVYQI